MESTLKKLLWKAVFRGGLTALPSHPCSTGLVCVWWCSGKHDSAITDRCFGATLALDLGDTVVFKGFGQKCSGVSVNMWKIKEHF